MATSPVNEKSTTQRSASEHVEKGTEHAKQTASRAADRAEKEAHSAVDKVAEAAASVAEHGGDWMDEARGFVRDNPTKSLLIAVGAGWLIGRLMRR